MCRPVGGELDRLVDILREPSARAKSLAVPTGTTASGTPARAAAVGARSRPSRRRRRRRSARGRRGGDVVGLVEVEAGRRRAARRGACARPPPPRPTRSPGWRAVRSSATPRWASCRGPRGPSGRCCWQPCARSRTASRPARRPCREACGGVLAGAERLVDALLRPPRGARQQEREDREDDADGDDYRDGHWRVSFPGYRCAARLPGRLGAETGQNGARDGRRRRLRAPVSARRAAAVRRGFLGLDRRLQPGRAAARRGIPRRTARRRQARLELVAEPARDRRGPRLHARRRRDHQRPPRPSGARGPESARQDGARRVRDPAGAATAHLRRPD